MHFIADNPPPASVARLEQVFRDTGGDLKALATAVVEDPAAWTPGPGKMRPPVEFVTASYRLLALPQGPNAPRLTQAAMQACRLMGQFPMAAPSPKGWSDQSQGLVGARCGALPPHRLRPCNWRTRLASPLCPAPQVVAIADAALGPRLTAATTRQAITASANTVDALALLLAVAPEFQRR